MKLRFKNKVAVITGAGRGIGYEIARQLVCEGAFVVLNDIDEAIVKESAATLNAAGPGSCIPMPGDAADISVISEMVACAVNEFGQLDMAVANAGNTIFSNFLDVAVADFEKIIGLNIQGSFFLAQIAAKQMCRQANGGRILLVSSTIGLQAHPNLATYSMTKGALHMLAKSIVLDLSPHNITINVVAPGATITERTLQESPSYEKMWSTVIPRGRTALPKDIAHASLFLLSPESEHITGHILVVDGGWTTAGRYPVPDPKL